MIKLKLNIGCNISQVHIFFLIIIMFYYILWLYNKKIILY